MDFFSSLFDKAASFFKATTSGFAGQDVIIQRFQICGPCPERIVAPDGFSYCRACGCGRWPAARLNNKLRLNDLKCPLNKF